MPTISNIMADGHMGYRAKALRVARSYGMARARDFQAAGIPPAYLKRMTDAGELIRLGRGLYQTPDQMGQDIEHDLAEAARLVPHGVVSLVSALRHHDLTTQLPNAVWMTIPHKARSPSGAGSRFEVVRASGETLTAGVGYALIEGVDVPIFNVAKTVADCFKHRRHVGEDVAIEALRDALKSRRTTPSELMAFGHVNRVARRMAPYIEAFS